MSLLYIFAINLQLKFYLLKKIIILLFFGTPFLAISQTPEKKETRRERQAKIDARIRKMQSEAEQGALIFNKQSAFSISLRSDGYGIGYEQGKYKKINKTNLWWFTLGERRHFKEEKLIQQTNLGFQIGNPYIYGKQNNFYFLNIGFGKQLMLGSKSAKNGVAVSAIYGGGLTLGMLKPYYLEAFNNIGTTDIIKFDDDNNRFTDPNSIKGSAPFGRGFNEIKYVPGVFTKGALRFDFGRYNDIMSALEMGVSAEYYSQKMPIMLLNKEKNLFVTGYVSLIFGSRR
jgi:hypothetical protein